MRGGVEHAVDYYHLGVVVLVFPPEDVAQLAGLGGACDDVGSANEGLLVVVLLVVGLVQGHHPLDVEIHVGEKGISQSIAQVCFFNECAVVADLAYIAVLVGFDVGIRLAVAGFPSRYIHSICIIIRREIANRIMRNH